MDITSTSKEKVKVKLNPNGALGGTPVWSIVSGNATIEADTDGLAAFLISPDVADVSVYKVVAPLDVAGTRNLEENGAYTVTLAEATELNISSETAVPK
jgi:hypothetical protein